MPRKTQAIDRFTLLNPHVRFGHGACWWAASAPHCSRNGADAVRFIAGASSASLLWFSLLPLRGALAGTSWFASTEGVRQLLRTRDDLATATMFVLSATAAAARPDRHRVKETAMYLNPRHSKLSHAAGPASDLMTSHPLGCLGVSGAPSRSRLQTTGGPVLQPADRTPSARTARCWDTWLAPTACWRELGPTIARVSGLDRSTATRRPALHHPWLRIAEARHGMARSCRTWNYVVAPCTHGVASGRSKDVRDATFDMLAPPDRIAQECCAARLPGIIEDVAGLASSTSCWAPSSASRCPIDRTSSWKASSDQSGSNSTCIEQAAARCAVLQDQYRSTTEDHGDGSALSQAARIEADSDGRAPSTWSDDEVWSTPR